MLIYTPCSPSAAPARSVMKTPEPTKTGTVRLANSTSRASIYGTASALPTQEHHGKRVVSNGNISPDGDKENTSGKGSNSLLPVPARLIHSDPKLHNPKASLNYRPKLHPQQTGRDEEISNPSFRLDAGTPCPAGLSGYIVGDSDNESSGSHATVTMSGKVYSTLHTFRILHR